MRAKTVVAGLVIGVGASVAGADVLRWINASGGSWTDAANWDAGRVPTQQDDVVLDLPGTYTINVPQDGYVGLVSIRNGNVVLTGPGVLSSISGQGGVGLTVGQPGQPASLTVSGARFYHVASAGDTIQIEPGSRMEVTTGGSLYTTHSGADIKVGATLVISGGTFNPGWTRLRGTGLVTSGLLTGEFMEIGPAANLLVTGPSAVVRSQEGWGTIGGTIQVTDGGRLNLYAGTDGIGVNISASDGGLVEGSNLELDAASSVVVGEGGVWRVTSTYRGPVTARAGADFLIGGVFHSTLDVDQAAIVTRGFIALKQGLTVEIDGAAEPAAALVPAYGQNNWTYITGPLNLRVRNANALRPGDVIPIFRHELNDTQAFSALNAPSIGGGRVLTLSRTGNPATTSIVVSQGPPSCYLDADFNGDGDIGTDQDIEAFFACIGGTCCAACASADFNGDGDTATDQDIEAFFHVLGGGSC
ncbi:MAG TPA: hypothetical protein VD997_07600 [Phycisphaerales bacterium]|nr:hypothetical protein [Phycisphaerales bacterium]